MKMMNCLCVIPSKTRKRQEIKTLGDFFFCNFFFFPFWLEIS